MSKTNSGHPSSCVYLLSAAAVLIIAYSNHENLRVGNIILYIVNTTTYSHRRYGFVVVGLRPAHTVRRPAALVRFGGPGGGGGVGNKRLVFESYRSGLGRWSSQQSSSSSSSTSSPWSSAVTAATAGEYAGRILINASAAAEFRRVVCKPRIVLTQRRPMNTKCVHITYGVWMMQAAAAAVTALRVRL